jgi:LmbE family N-acetylglucosaminyl deacetylase
VSRGWRDESRALAGRVLRKLPPSSFEPRLRHDPAAPPLVLSPHMDDAVLSCWSVLTAEGPVNVVNVFTGLPRDGPPGDWDRICGAREAPLHVRDRLIEDVAALAHAGREAVYLPFVEEQYRDRLATPSARRIDRELALRLPEAGRVLAPLAAYHADHQVARAYALALMRAGFPVTLYAELPFGLRFGWPHWVTGSAANPRLHPEVGWSAALAGVGAEIPPPRTVKLADDESERKLAALRAYGTQFPALDGGDIGILRNPVLRGYEVFWDFSGGRTA